MGKGKRAWTFKHKLTRNDFRAHTSYFLLILIYFLFVTIPNIIELEPFYILQYHWSRSGLE